MIPSLLPGPTLTRPGEVVVVVGGRLRLDSMMSAPVSELAATSAPVTELSVRTLLSTDPARKSPFPSEKFATSEVPTEPGPRSWAYEPAESEGVVADVGGRDLVVDDVVVEDGVGAVQRVGGAARQCEEQRDEGDHVLLEVARQPAQHPSPPSRRRRGR